MLLIIFLICIIIAFFLLDTNENALMSTRSKISTKSTNTSSSSSGKPPLPPQLVRTRSIHANIASTSMLESNNNSISTSLEALALHGMDINTKRK